MNNVLTVTAQTLGFSFAGDPELNLPERPRYIAEAVAIPYGQNGLLFDGVRGVQVIMGRSARTFLPRLLPMLDGNRTLDELTAAFPQMPRRALHDSLALLYSRGLLEDGPAQPCVDQLAELSAFAGRYCDVTRVNRSRVEVLGRLAARRVAVAATPLGEAVVEALAGQGLEALELIASPAELAAADVDLLIGVFGAADMDARKWFAAAHDRQVRALHVRVAEDVVEVGPYFIPGDSGCYDCFRALQPVSATSEGAADEAFWSAVAALHALNLLSRLGPVKLYNSCRVHRRTEDGALFEKVSLARLPGCPTCGLEGAAPRADHPDARTWVLHNASHVMTAKELRSPRDHQIHYAATNVELTRKEPSPRHGAIQLPLPGGLDLDLPPLWSAPAEPRERVDLPLLSTLLRFTAGYQPTVDGQRRIAPSGGGLASADLFLVVRRFEGLEPGIYHYFGWRHQLERVGIVPDAMLAGALGTLETELPPLLVIGTSDMRKTRQKYDEFSFRIGVLDSGVARQFLQDIADAAGVATTEYPDVRDSVMAHLLHLPSAGNRHMQTFALGLGAVRIASERPDGLFHHYQSPDALIAMCARLGPTPVRHTRRLPPPKVAPHVVKSLGQLMLGRRSQRSFSERPLPGSVIQSLAALADDAARRRDRASGLTFEMGFWAIVLRSTDLEAGVYRWDSAEGALRLHRRGADRDDILTTMQQHGYADAPVTCFVSADFGDALTRHGPRGYREIGSRAGSMLARAQVAALGWDAVGSMWGGIADEGVGRLLGVDRYTDCPLFAASFGYAADD